MEIKFCDALFAERRAANLPPFSYQVLLRSNAKSLAKALGLLTAVKAIVRKSVTSVAKLELSGPVPAPMEKRIGVFHAQLLLQAQKRGLLQEICHNLISSIDRLPQAKGVYWSIDVDPIEMY